MNLFFFKNMMRAQSTFQSRDIDELYEAMTGDHDGDTLGNVVRMPPHDEGGALGKDELSPPPPDETFRRAS